MPKRNEVYLGKSNRVYLGKSNPISGRRMFVMSWVVTVSQWIFGILWPASTNPLELPLALASGEALWAVGGEKVPAESMIT